MRDELIKLLQERVRDPRIKGLTVTEVTLTPDRRTARVYIANFGSEEDLQIGLEGLQSCKGLLRHEISQLLHWNFVPELDFRMDRSWNYGQRIDSLLSQLNEASTQTPDEKPESQELEDDDDDL